MPIKPDLEEVRFLTSLFPNVGISPKSVLRIPESLASHKIFIVPAGIGDIAWCYSKLYSLNEPFILAIADGCHPHASSGIALRALPFVELLDKVKLSTIALCTSPQSTWAAYNSYSVNGDHLPDSPSYFSVNTWLEHGNKLDDFMPFLPTVRSFPLLKPSRSEEEADIYLGGSPAFAIYPASRTYFGDQNLPLSGWVRIVIELSKVKKHYKIVLLGAPWDINLLLPLQDTLCALGFEKRIVFCHDRSFATTMAILRRCQFLVSAASGLGIVAEYQGIPTVHLYPPHLYEGPSQKGCSLMGTWETPDMVRSGNSLSLKMGRPDNCNPVENTRERVMSLVEHMLYKFTPLK